VRGKQQSNKATTRNSTSHGDVALPGNSTVRPPKLDVKVIMPEGWTPKMYVAALNKAMKRHSILCLETIAINGRMYVTVNELQWLFSASDEATHSQLTCSASYIRVSGGVLKKL
jgi:hypothetical protein